MKSKTEFVGVKTVLEYSKEDRGLLVCFVLSRLNSSLERGPSEVGLHPSGLSLVSGRQDARMFSSTEVSPA